MLPYTSDSTSQHVDNHIAVLDNPDDSIACDALRVRLASMTINELKQCFDETFQHLKMLKKERFSQEALHPVQYALLEILVELRVRGYEADNDGVLYTAPIVYPVPKDYKSAWHRQVYRLKKMPFEHLCHLCSKTLSNVMKIVRTASKQNYYK